MADMPSITGESKTIARFARWSQRIVASPFAPLVTLLVVALALFALPTLGFDAERLAQVEFGVALVTLLLVFMLEHNEQRDTIALHVKLDEILLALGADEDKVGVEELPAAKLERVRDAERRKAAAR
ncbi:MAG TPA: low affinity iron permease family protein [Candidatus Acidoferrales bacterium]|jgi:low affinity Fe/Cu permease|nr:low affinity iron permease family protein [Candidatus Acidoferrales bacterium]